MEYVKDYLSELAILLLDMAPWLLLGFLIAGILHVFFPEGKVNRLIGSSNTRSVIGSALLGVPLPLCSCGVIPAGISLHKSGASRGSAVSFLISTPQTGVDSVLVTYSLLGLPMAVIRPVVAFITGIFGGIFTNKYGGSKTDSVAAGKINSTASSTEQTNPIKRIMQYAFVDFLADIAKWIVAGLLVAALIAVLVPDDFFSGYIKNDLWGMVIILLVSIPIYVCATSSVPIAAVLMLKGLSPGAALVFLMAGPASNAATITVIGKVLGKRVLIIYLITLAAGAFFFGMVINYFLPREWFVNALSGIHEGHSHDLLPYWLRLTSGIILALLIINIYVRKLFKKNSGNTKSTSNSETSDMHQFKVKVKGMTCAHCKMNVETNIKAVAGVKNVSADIEKGEVLVEGLSVDLEKVKSAVEGIGYTFSGLLE